ncbi:MAG TPA: hypothetical protein VMU46_12885, partial [Burkholderiales bacterium]|nr:hypothetical protein [Burkholderiales bacterium]
MATDAGSDDQEERIGTAPPLERTPGDTLNAHVPYEDLYRTIVAGACEHLALALGPRYGRNIVARVLEALPREGEGDPDIIRRMHEADLSVLSEVWFVDFEDIAADFAILFAFARHGESPGPDPEAGRAEIEALLAHFRRFIAAPGIKESLSTGFEWFTDTLAAAEARWAIDHGRSVAPDELAALAGIKPKTIANLVAARQIPTDTDGRVPAAEALRYLKRRKDFVWSTWQEAWPTILPEEPASSLPALPEQVFVPVDADGNAFLPSLARRGRDGILRYTIGEKSAPEYVADYWKALERLARMPV